MPSHHFCVRSFGVVALTAMAGAATAGGAHAQIPEEAAARSATSDYRAPRTRFGHPSLEGIWNQNYYVILEAASDAPLALPEAEAQQYWEQVVGASAGAIDQEDLDPELSDIWRRTDGLPLVRGERRTRTVVWPEDGVIPYTEAGRAESDRGTTATREFDSYEVRPGWERCLVGLGLPPITNVGVGEENPRQIVQTEDHVIIFTEYGNEARIVPLTDTHRPDVMHGIMGDAIGRWEGETLVIETVSLPEADRVRLISSLVAGENSKVIERYTRVAEDELLYQYTVEDPEIYSGPWLAEYSLYPTEQRMFEGTCHEGNYALPNILQGARAIEAREAAAATEGR